MSRELLRPGYLAGTAFCLDMTRLAGISFLPAHFHCGLKMLHLSILTYPLAYCTTIEKKKLLSLLPVTLYMLSLVARLVPCAANLSFYYDIVHTTS